MTVQVQSTMDKEQIYELINVDPDARRYFFHKADERWLDWLWRNGFLSAIKEENAAPFATRTPELEYLLRMAEKRPDSVVDIMLDTPISTDTRSQEVAYGFLRICSSLPADQLARVVEKIRAERWIPLIDAIYRHSSFKCAEMLKTLADANDFEAVLVLADAVLAVRPREELEDARLNDNNPFYLEYLTRAGIFEQLASLQAEFAEGALALAIRKLSEVLITFDNFWLLEVDFFNLQPGQSDPWQEEVRELAAVVKTLAVRLIGKRCDDAHRARDFYARHFASLPNNRVMRRLRFFVLSLCPAAFEDYLKQAYFSLFKAENDYDVLAGTEYEKALREGFHVLSAKDKEHYVEGLLDFFGRQPDRKHSGSQILSMILPYLNRKPELKDLAKNTGFELDANYEPKPDWREDGEFKEITPRPPITREAFGKRPIAEITTKLRSEWTPASLNAQNADDDYHNPRNARGVGELLRKNIPERLQKYVDNANRFFERDVLDQHYTYEYLVGIQEAIKNHSKVASEVNWDGVISLCCAIRDSGEKEPFPREEREYSGYGDWLANWDAVHSAVADTLRELLTERDRATQLDFGRYRDQIYAIVAYLLTYPDPSPADEQFDMPGGASDLVAMRNDADDKWAIDPFTMAINSVRGRAFEVYVRFLMLDGEAIRGDVKDLYEAVLQRENTRALMSMFGRYLPTFYFRSMEWTRRLLPLIFPLDSSKNQFFSAAWEGYLSARLYGEMLSDPAIQALYQRALHLTDSDYPRGQRHLKAPDKGIAEHLALAYMHFKEFGLGHQLLQAFWKNENPRQHAYFVQSLGRFFISRENSEEFFANNPEGKSRLKFFWDWVIENHENPETFKEFGLWINLDKKLFDPAWLAQRVKQTLKKTNGLLEWQHELIKSVPQLAQAAPEETLAISRLYLLEGGVRGNEQRTLWYWNSDDKWVKAFEILYRCPATKAQTEALINQLVREGGQAFWSLEKIVKDNP